MIMIRTICKSMFFYIKKRKICTSGKEDVHSTFFMISFILYHRNFIFKVFLRINNYIICLYYRLTPSINVCPNIGHRNTTESLNVYEDINTLPTKIVFLSRLFKTFRYRCGGIVDFVN